MALKLTEKKKVVLNIKKNINKSLSIIILHYVGLTSNEINDIRKNINKNSNNNVLIIKSRNSLLKLSVKNTIFECLSNYFINSILVILSFNFPGFASSLLEPYLKKYKDKLELKSLFVEGKIISLSLNDKLSKFISIDKALTYFIYFIKKISVMKIINVLLLISKKK